MPPKKEIDEYQLYNDFRTFRVEKRGGIKPFIKHAHLAPNTLYIYLRKWRANLAESKQAITGEPMMADMASAELDIIGRHAEEMKEKALNRGPLPPLSAGETDSKSMDKDSLRKLKQEARDLLQRGLRKKLDPSQIQNAKAILSIKEEAEDRVPNPYAGLAVEELVDRLLTTCVSMVGVKSIYRRLEFLNRRGEAEVVGEVSDFKPEGAKPVEEDAP